ncbi:acetyl-CoA carboxylase biotin carboxyl carrier protein [Clostridium tagluense]|nr:biotin/lipoyl-containing protein [Clostridium tagluense]MCB2311588.1 hypothetical protein [Clostridium tagluense]MCB2316312.1 hypothetical protein [Clostridium tagluense]MCB2326181.1 hypothetical protein [Clostridium tagluense]MCB2330904.1 hypothetical protein [Clostridium tagluense]WAG49462.1 hypothetical protein LL095_16355 [Clostridium tagluense]
MDIRLIKELIKTIDSSSISNFEYNDNSIRLKCTKFNRFSLESNSKSADEISCTVMNELLHEIKSKYVGIVHLLDMKTNKTFVTIGEKTNKGDLLCVIEYLKIFIEIRSDISGVVTEISVENGSMVDYGKKMFVIAL